MHPSTLCMHVSSHIRKHDPALYQLVLQIPKMGVASRKTLLDCCQTSRGFGREHDRPRLMLGLIADINLRNVEGTPTADELKQMVDHVIERKQSTDRPFQCLCGTKPSTSFRELRRWLKKALQRNLMRAKRNVRRRSAFRG